MQNIAYGIRLSICQVFHVSETTSNITNTHLKETKAKLWSSKFKIKNEWKAL